MISNQKIANQLEVIADSFKKESSSYYKIKAYRQVSRLLREMPISIAQLIHEGKDLTQLPGIGKGIARKIKEIIEKDTDSIKVPEIRISSMLMYELKQIPKLGKKRIYTLLKNYPIQSIEQFKQLLSEDKVASLPSFNEKLIGSIISWLNNNDIIPYQFYLFKAEPIVNRLIKYMQKNTKIKQLEIAGSYRLKKETINDIYVIVASDNPQSVIDYFLNYFEITQVIHQESNQIIVTFWSGLEVHLIMTSVSSFNTALFHFTGSEQFIQSIQELAKDKGLELNVRGIFKNKHALEIKNEKDIFLHLNLPYLEPELRENDSAIKLTNCYKEIQLITLEDLKGDLHSHTNNTDGRYSLEEMVAAAQKKGLSYLAITDHSKRLTIANGLDEKRLFAQIELIKSLNAHLKNFTILAGIEVDILEDGSLDFDNNILKELDLTVCSIHSKFNLPEKVQTERIIRAMDNPYFNILGHPTGRLINIRKPYKIDLERIFIAAKERHCFIEINSQPARLDINDIYARTAKDIGLKFSISSDAHNIKQLDLVRWGINQARRAGLEAKDVINTYGINEFKNVLKK